MKPSERVQRILNEAVGRDLTSWERHNFLPSVSQHDTLSEKQESTLAGIERKVFGEVDR